MQRKEINTGQTYRIYGSWRNRRTPQLDQMRLVTVISVEDTDRYPTHERGADLNGTKPGVRVRLEEAPRSHYNYVDGMSPSRLDAKVGETTVIPAGAIIMSNADWHAELDRRVKRSEAAKATQQRNTDGANELVERLRDLGLKASADHPSILMASRTPDQRVKINSTPTEVAEMLEAQQREIERLKATMGRQGILA